MRVLFHVAGGPELGMGHTMRCLELARTVAELGPQVVGFVANDDDQVENRITSQGFTRLAEVDAANPASTARLVDLVHRQSVDVVVLDFPSDCTIVSKALKTAHPDLSLVALDDFAMDNEHLDVIINLFNHNTQHRRPKRPDTHYYEGLEYAIVRPEFGEASRQQTTRSPEVRHMLMTFGGSDPRRRTLTALEALQLGAPPRFAIHVVVGPNFAHRDEVQHMVASMRTPCHLIDNPDHMAGLMSRCDVGLISGGTTMMEAACLGLPAVVLPQTTEEERFAAFCEDHGPIFRALSLNQLQPESVRQTLDTLTNDRDLRQAMSTAGRTSVDGRGRHRIATLIARHAAGACETRE